MFCKTPARARVRAHTHANKWGGGGGERTTKYKYIRDHFAVLIFCPDCFNVVLLAFHRMQRFRRAFCSTNYNVVLPVAAITAVCTIVNTMSAHSMQVTFSQHHISTQYESNVQPRQDSAGLDRNCWTGKWPTRSVNHRNVLEIDLFLKTK